MSSFDEPDQPSNTSSTIEKQYNVQNYLEDLITGHTYNKDGNLREDILDIGIDFTENAQLDCVELTEEAKKFCKLLKETDQELFCGCKKHNTLSFILELFHKKCMNGCSNKSFTELFGTLKETLSEGDKLPKSSYEVKKIILELGLGYEKIHVCPNSCMLYLERT